MQRFLKKIQNVTSRGKNDPKPDAAPDSKLKAQLGRNRAAMDCNERLNNINTSSDLSPTETINMVDDFSLSPKNGSGSTEASNNSNQGTPKNEEGQDQYRIKNIDTGEAFDLRTEQEKPAITPQNKVVIQGTPWNKFWKNIRKSNESLWDASESGDAKTVTELLDAKKQTYPAEIDSKSLDDWTALHMAVNCGHIQVVEVLLNNQANIEAKTSMLRTPLHLGCMRGSIEIVKLLVNCQASINTTDHEMNTPLHYASEHGFPDIVSFLLDRNPDIDVKNIWNLTCIDVTNSVEIRKIFEDKGFTNEKHIVHRFGRTIIDDSILYNGRSDIIGKLLSFNNHNMKMMQKKTIKDQSDLNKTEQEISSKEQSIVVSQDDQKSSPNESIKDSIKDSIKESVKESIKESIKVEKKEEEEDQKEMVKSVVQVQAEKPKEPPVEKKEKITFSNIKIDTYLKGSESVPTSSEREIVGPKSFMRHDTLGKGSFGEVYLVEKISDGKLYAMKVLKKDRILNQNLTRYAKTERNVLSVMDHPFIVKLNYAFQTETKLYLFLDYCPGGDMGNLIATMQKIPEKVAKIYAAEITLALEALHNKDIIFRDLKPDNVVLDKDGHACLTDFGLSKEGMKEGLTKSFLGSIAYLAPEILTKAGHNKTVDWYLLCVLIYEMLVGVPPYFNRDKAKLFDNIKTGQLKLPKSLSEEARSILILLLKRDPSKRLGYNKDAEEIKKHPWFASINWDDALARKLKPPPLGEDSVPQFNKLINSKIDDVKEIGERKNFIDGWSFVKQT